MDRRAAFSSSPRSGLARLFPICVALICAVAALRAQSQPIRYIYDELGRLVAVIDSTGAAAVYHYDAVGNLLSITRQNAGVVSMQMESDASGLTFFAPIRMSAHMDMSRF